MKTTITCILTAALTFFFSQKSLGADWPESQWLEGRPSDDSVLTAVAFGSPVDLQFLKLMNVWKRLDKKYHGLKVDFLMIARNEPLLPFSEEMVRAELSEANYHLPVYLDPFGNYSKLWRAYVTPTVNLVLKNRKVISFDPGNFDPGQFEKILQKTLKENGLTAMPPREFPNEGETKNCGHSHTLFLGERFQRTWNSTPVTMGDNWSPKPLWVEKNNKEQATVEAVVNRGSVALLAETKEPNSVHVLLTLDGKRIPTEVKGKDVSEDKAGNTFVTIKGKKLYEILTHSTSLPAGSIKFKLSTSGNNLKLWSLQVIPSCQDFGT